MGEAEGGPTARVERTAGLDTSVAHPARVYDYWLGGKDNFAADREAAERVLAVTPGLRFRVRAHRVFLGRAAGYLAREAGIRQFLDIGTGIPAADNAHEVASGRLRTPGCCTSTTTRSCCWLPTPWCRHPTGPDRLPARRPAAARDDRGPGGGRPGPRPAGRRHAGRGAAPVAGLRDPRDRGPADGACRGSHLALTQPATTSTAPRRTAAGRQRAVSIPQTLRTREQVARFFTGLELVEPGLVQVHQWRPDPGDFAPEGVVSAHGAVARKPR